MEGLGLGLDVLYTGERNTAKQMHKSKIQSIKVDYNVQSRFNDMILFIYCTL